MKYILASIFSFILLSASAQQMASLKDLQKIMDEPGRIKVINFWATWCGPCIKELPYFDEIHRKNKNVSILLVSMDYDLDPNPEKVKRFIARKKILSPVVILTEENPSGWIDKIDKNWSGALPATIIIGATGKRKLIQGELKKDELEKYINEASQ